MSKVSCNSCDAVKDIHEMKLCNACNNYICMDCANEYSDHCAQCNDESYN